MHECKKKSENQNKKHGQKKGNVIEFMENFIKNSSKEINSILRILILLLFAFGVFLIYEAFFGYYIFARFNELGPVTKNMSVYYKGFEIGKTMNIEPDEDYKRSIVKIIFKHKNTKLPKNTYVIVNHFPDGQKYLELIYPDKPALKRLANRDVIEGKSLYSMESFMRGQTGSGTSDLVSQSVLRALSSADATNVKMQFFFENSSQVLQENRESIRKTFQNTERMTKSLAEMAENLNQTSKKLNDSIDKDTLKKTTLNITKSTENIVTATGKIGGSTTDIDKTMKKIDLTVDEAHSAAANINKITTSLNNALGKRFAGIRILFGKPMQNCSPQK